MKIIPIYHPTGIKSDSVHVLVKTNNSFMRLTCQPVPLVDSKEAVGGDGDDGGGRQTRLGVGRYVRYGRIGRELQHHDDVLLHLLGKHQRRLQEKILFRDGQQDDAGK